MKLKKLQAILLGSLGIVFLPALFAIVTKPESSLELYVTTIIFAMIWGLFSRLLWRCPHCKGFLGKVEERKKHCPHCKKRIDWDAGR